MSRQHRPNRVGITSGTARLCLTGGARILGHRFLGHRFLGHRFVSRPLTCRGALDADPDPPPSIVGDRDSEGNQETVFFASRTWGLLGWPTLCLPAGLAGHLRRC